MGRRRGSIPSLIRRGRGGEVAPTENGTTSDGPSHSPLLMNEAVPAPQNFRRAAGSSAQPKILCGSTPERTQQGYQAFPSSDDVHGMPSNMALRFRDSSFCSQDARRGANSFVRGGLLGPGTSTRTSRIASNPTPMPPGATRGSRDSSHRCQDARCAISTSFRRGGVGEPTLTRSQQGYHATFAGGGNQCEAMSSHLLPLGAAPTFRHSRSTPQDARLAGGSLVRMRPLRGQTTLSSQQECRTTLGDGGAHGGIGSGSSPRYHQPRQRVPVAQDRPPHPRRERNMWGATSRKHRSNGS